MSTELKILLPCGLVEEDGTINRECVITEMTGKTQALMGRRDLQKQPDRLLRQILQNCLVSFAGRDVISDAILTDMFIGDRDFILFEVRRLSLGNDFDVRAKCSSCEEAISEGLNLADVEVFDLPVPDDPGSGVTMKPVSLEEGADPKLTRVWTVKSPDGRYTVRGRYPTVGDLEAADDKNQVTAVYKILNKTLFSIEEDGEKHESPLGMQFFESAPMVLVNYLSSLLVTNNGGPEVIRQLTCGSCDQENTVRVESANFFVSKAPDHGKASTLIRRSGSSAR